MRGCRPTTRCSRRLCLRGSAAPAEPRLRMRVERRLRCCSNARSWPGPAVGRTYGQLTFKLRVRCEGSPIGREVGCRMTAARPRRVLTLAAIPPHSPEAAMPPVTRGAVKYGSARCGQTGGGGFSWRAEGLAVATGAGSIIRIANVARFALRK